MGATPARPPSLLCCLAISLVLHSRVPRATVGGSPGRPRGDGPSDVCVGLALLVAAHWASLPSGHAASTPPRRDRLREAELLARGHTASQWKALVAPRSVNKKRPVTHDEKPAPSPPRVPARWPDSGSIRRAAGGGHRITGEALAVRRLPQEAPRRRPFTCRWSERGRTSPHRPNSLPGKGSRSVTGRFHGRGRGDLSETEVEIQAAAGLVAGSMVSAGNQDLSLRLPCHPRVAPPRRLRVPATRPR